MRMQAALDSQAPGTACHKSCLCLRGWQFKHEDGGESKKKKKSMFQLQAIISNYTHSSAPGEKFFLPPTLSALHVDTGDCGLILEIAGREEKKKLTDIMRSSP